MVEKPKWSFMELFLKKPVPFSSKRDVNWVAVKNVLGALVGIAVIFVLFLPGKEPSTEQVQESDELKVPEQRTLEEMPDTSGRGYRAAMGYSGGGGSGSTRSRASAMIVSRDGLDSQTQAHPGSRIRVKLTQRVVVSTQGMPVIGVVVEDFEQDGIVAIPRGSKVFGEVTFDQETKRGALSWRSIQIGNGRVRTFSALSTSLDGQAGVEGQVHSDAVKNALGQTMTRFIGAYAEGSMERTAFFGSPGGKENGMKNAIAETAKDQADRMADKLKKEREWLELQPGQEFLALLTEPFRFRDPGGSY